MRERNGWSLLLIQRLNSDANQVNSRTFHKRKTIPNLNAYFEYKLEKKLGLFAPGLQYDRKKMQHICPKKRGKREQKSSREKNTDKKWVCVCVSECMNGPQPEGELRAKR